MERVEYKTKTGLTQYKPVLYGMPDEGGWCLKCGQEVSGVEPDARRYTCECCGEPKVYGLEELLVMGLVEVRDEN